MELIIFTAFLAVQAAAKSAPHVCERIAHLAIIQRLSQHHWVVWLLHPVVLHSVHDYAIHFVIYSGYIIRTH